jgi:hypothetical protein
VSAAIEHQALSKAGNPIRRLQFPFVDSCDWNPARYAGLYERHGYVDTHQEPYCQMVYGVTRKGCLVAITFCEGDVDIVSCATQADLDREVTTAKEFYDTRYKT